jgi:hypothetical protein
MQAGTEWASTWLVSAAVVGMLCWLPLL